MHPETLKVSGEQLPYFRTSDFSEKMKEIECLIKKMTYAVEEDKVILLTTSGTGAMEATVINCFGTDDKLLVISGGSFGKRFCDICDVHGFDYDTISLEFGKALTSEELAKYSGRGYSGLLVNLDETSTGQLYDLEMLSAFCRSNDMLLVVDAISAFLADEIDFSKNNIDALIVSSQKALSLSPGLSIIELSKRMCERVNRSDPKSFYMDLKMYLRDMERGQTPFTPAVGIILELLDRLRMIEASGGVEHEIGLTRFRAEYFRSKIAGLPITLPEYRLSNAVTPIIFNNHNAYDIFEKLRKDYDLTVTPSGGELRDKVLRVSHIGNLKTEDYDALIDAFKKELKN